MWHFTAAETHCGHAEASISQWEILLPRVQDVKDGVLRLREGAVMLTLHCTLDWLADSEPWSVLWGEKPVGASPSSHFFSASLLHVSVTNYTDSLLPSLPPFFCFKPNGGWQENTQKKGSLEDCVLGIRRIPQRQVYQWALKSTTDFFQSSQERKQPR